jgi:hypothetical protein
MVREGRQSRVRSARLVLTMEARGLVQIALPAAVSAGNAGRERRGPSQTPPAHAVVRENRQVIKLLPTGWGFPLGGFSLRAVHRTLRTTSGRMIVRRPTPTGSPWLVFRFCKDSLTRLSIHPGLDGERLGKSESSGLRWTGMLTHEPNTLCQPAKNDRRGIRPGPTPCFRSCVSVALRSRSVNSTAWSAPLLLISSSAIRITPTTRSAKSCSGSAGRAWSTTSEKACGRRGSDPRSVGIEHGHGGRIQTKSETGQRRGIGWSSAARGCSARLGTMGIGGDAVGISCPRCADRNLLRLTGLFTLSREIQTRSPPASGGPEQMPRPERYEHKAEPVRRDIRRKLPNNDVHGTWIELARHTKPCVLSIPRTRLTKTFPIRDRRRQTTAGAKVIKDASAHPRCGSKVLCLGSTACRIHVEVVVFGRHFLAGLTLAHLDDGFGFQFSTSHFAERLGVG